MSKLILHGFLVLLPAGPATCIQEILSKLVRSCEVTNNKHKKHFHVSVRVELR